MGERHGDCMSERRRMMMTVTGGGGLPSEYQQVEYIESNGTQYIDTDYKPSSDTLFDAEMQMTSTSGRINPFGVYDTATSSYFDCEIYYGVRFRWGNVGGN